MPLTELPIKSIEIGDRRALGDITELANSIKTIGLINPITVTHDHKLVCGHHRLKACESLGFELIPAQVLTMSDVEARIAEIDENLIRNELTVLEQSKQLAERKSLYLEMHPETAAGGDRKSDCAKNQNENISFCSDAASKTGKSKRTIEMKTRIGESLHDIEEDIIEAGLDDNQTELTELARINEKEPEKAKEVLAVIKNGDAKNVKSAVRKLSIDQQKKQIEEGNVQAPTGLYDVISIDPPWKYEQGEKNSYDSNGRRVANPYPEMTLDEIKALNIPAKDDCVMWLWTTQKYLRDSFDLLDHWGFDHKATMVWDKDQIGMGHWLRMQCEFCILAIKGKPVWSNTEVRDIIRERRREHSRKPESFYSVVDKICVGRKLDFFSREKREGWDNFGNDNELFNR